MYNTKAFSSLTLAGIVTTANALWVPEKRAITFQNAEQSGQEDPKKTTHSEKKTTTDSTPHTTNSSAKKTKTASASATKTSGVESNVFSNSSNSASAVTSNNTSDSSSTSTPTPTMPSVMSRGVVTQSATSSALPSSSIAADKSISASSSSSTGAIAGGVVAAVAIIAIGLAALLFVRRKRRRELKQSRAARMSTRADPYTEGYSEPKPYTDCQNQPVHDTNPVALAPPPPMTAAPTKTVPAVMNEKGDQTNHGFYEPGMTQHKETIEQQQQQYYQSQTSVADPAPAVPAVVVSGESNQTPSLGTFTVIATYIPTLSDELEIEPGDRIELLVEYDDGWCQGINITRNYAKGVFPRHCIDYATAPSEKSSMNDVERTKRVSSMYVTGPN
ncbi:hypothetical protein BY458DRAFT_456021 [Sporodiniella umbellata]|nr:hypothetical protein BY458DRAFT_456021 [Sporodiniella umbellata]